MASPSPPHSAHLFTCIIDLRYLHSAYTDFGHFLTGSLVVTGFAMPLIFQHAQIIEPAACWMSIAGGSLVYGTILVYAGAFSQGHSDDF